MIEKQAITMALPEASGGMISAIEEANNVLIKNNEPVTTEAKPVLAPTEIPAALSMNGVRMEVPKNGATNVLQNPSTRYILITFPLSERTLCTF